MDAKTRLEMLEYRIEWEKQGKRLQALLDKRDGDRKFILYMGGAVGTYHLGERDRLDLHLMGACAGEVEEFIIDNTREMFRFIRQTELGTPDPNRSQWIQDKLCPHWFRSEAERDPSAYRAVRMSALNLKLRLDVLPLYSGIYVVADGRAPSYNAGIIYVGETERSIRQRLKTHEKLQQFLIASPTLIVHCFNQQFFDYGRKQMERRFIRQLNPLLNIRLKSKEIETA